ncbi:MAG: RNA polymerase sigma factor [Candidatus Zixiibacteriota bacterium]
MRWQKKFAEKTVGGYILPMPPDKSDVKLIEAYLAGQRAANNEVEKLIQSAWRPWRPRFGFETDDIISDVRYKLLISLRRGDFGHKSTLKTYISRIVSHTSIDYLRFRERVKPVDLDSVPLPDKTLLPDEQLEKKQAARISFRVIRLMSKDCRQLWRMQLKGGMTCREIGNSMGKTEGNIRRQLWACRKRAKEIRQQILKRDKQF